MSENIFKITTDKESHGILLHLDACRDKTGKRPVLSYFCVTDTEVQTADDFKLCRLPKECTPLAGFAPGLYSCEKITRKPGPVYFETVEDGSIFPNIDSITPSAELLDENPAPTVWLDAKLLGDMIRDAPGGWVGLRPVDWNKPVLVHYANSRDVDAAIMGSGLIMPMRPPSN